VSDRYEFILDEKNGHERIRNSSIKSEKPFYFIKATTENVK
jgi:hypothetical protein